MSLPLYKQIKIKMVEKGETNASIARKIGVSSIYVCWTIYGRRLGKKVRRGICEILDLPEDIWDEMPRPRKKAA